MRWCDHRRVRRHYRRRQPGRFGRGYERCGKLGGEDVRISATDGGANKKIVCLQGNYAPDGTALDETVSFGCACVRAEQYCSEACKATADLSADGLEYYDVPDGGPPIILCGCTWVSLL